MGYWPEWREPIAKNVRHLLFDHCTAVSGNLWAGRFKAGALSLFGPNLFGSKAA